MIDLCDVAVKFRVSRAEVVDNRRQLCLAAVRRFARNVATIDPDCAAIRYDGHTTAGFGPDVDGGERALAEPRMSWQVGCVSLQSHEERRCPGDRILAARRLAGVS